MSLISCLTITSLSLASRDKKRVKQRVYQRIQKREFTEILGWESVTHMSLITCHSSHVTHLMPRSQVTHLMSGSHVTHHLSLISYLITISLISCLIIMCLMSFLYVTETMLLPIYPRVARFNFCPWPLPTSHRTILPVTSAQPLRSNICPPCSVLLPRRIGIGF